MSVYTVKVTRGEIDALADLLSHDRDLLVEDDAMGGLITDDAYRHLQALHNRVQAALGALTDAPVSDTDADRIAALLDALNEIDGGENTDPDELRRLATLLRSAGRPISAAALERGEVPAPLTDPHFASEAQEVFTEGGRIFAVAATHATREGGEGVYEGRLDDRRAVVRWDTPDGSGYRETVSFGAIRNLYR